MAFSGGYSPLAAAAASGGPGDTTLTQSSTFTNANTVNYAHVVTPGEVILTASLFNNTNTFYGPSVSLVTNLVQNGPYNWFGSSEWSSILSPDPDTFYSATISTTVVLTAALFTNSPTFYGPTVTTGAVDLAPSLYTNNGAFYAHNVNLVVSQETRFDNMAVFYAATVDAGSASPQDLTPSLFTNTASFYGPTVSLVLVQNGPYNWFGSSEWSSILSPDPDTFYSPSISLGLTAARYDNTATFYSPTVTIFLAQGTRFDNTQAFYGPTVGSVTNLTQTARFDNSNGFYGHTVGLYLTPNLVTNTNGFYAPQVNLVLLATPASNTNQFFVPTVVVSGGEQSLIQVVTPSNTQTFYGHEVFLEQLLVPLRHENAQTFYGPSLRNQYPDPSKVLVGTIYGEPGLEFMGTWVPDLDKSIKVDIVSGKLVKLINNKVALTL